MFFSKHSAALIISQAILLMLFAITATAQSSPEVLYRLGYLNGDCLAVPPSTSFNSLSASGTVNDGPRTYTHSGTASTSGMSLSMNTDLDVDRPSGSTGGAYCNGIQFEIFTLHPADMTITGTGSASGSFSGGSGGTIGYGAHPINDTTYSLSQGGSAANASGGASQVVNLACGASAITNLPGYSGIGYYRAYPSSGVYRYKGSVTLGGTGAASGGVSASGSVSVAYGTSSPVAKIGPQYVAANTTYAVNLTNDSYDPDGPGGNQATCYAAWSVTGPGGFSASSTNNTSFSFTPPTAGVYTVNLAINDNEGGYAATSRQIGVHDPTGAWPGIYGRSPEVVNECGGAGNGGSAGGGDNGVSFQSVLNIASGNAAVRVTDPVHTRGFPLRLDAQINNQIKFSARKTNLANAEFTYSIAMYKHTYTSGGTTYHDRYLIDADGTTVYLGTWSGTPSVPSYFKGTLTSATLLEKAGPPGRLSYAGNYKYQFNSDGTLYRITDPRGNIQETTYDGSGRLTTVTDLSTNKTLSFLYSGSATRAYRVVENGGETKIDFTYTSDRITNVAVKDSSLNIMHQLDITYNGSGLVSTIQKDGDSASTMTYTYVTQANGTALGNISWTGGGTNFNYFGPQATGEFSRTVVTDSNGNETAYDFDNLFLLKKVTLPVMFGASNPPTYTYTVDRTNYTTTSVSDGATTADFTYNSKGKVTQIDNNAGGVWDFTYAANGIDLTQIEDSVGTVLTLVYGDSGQPHMPTSITGADGQTWTKTYNGYGQVLTVVPPTGSPTGTTTYTYETSTSSPNYAMLKTITNGAGDVTQFTGYTSLGEVTSIVQTPESGTNITTSFEYDGSQRLTEVTLPDSKTKTYTYSGRKLDTVTDEAGNNTAYSFCAICGKKSGMTMEMSKSLSWQTDGDHRTTGFTDARTNQTVYTYGDAGELKQTTYPDSSYTKYRYDDYGRLRQKEDTRGNTEDYTYDSAGRVETVTLTPYGGSPVDMDYTFNADDTVATVTDEVGTTTYTYNTGRRVSNVAYDWNASGLSTVQNVAYTYNEDGTVDTMTWKNGTTTVASWTYGYDGAGRTTSVANNFSETTSYTYDGVGKMKTQSNQNGTSLTYSWNQQRGWPTQIQYKLSSTAFAQYDLVYDDGNDTVGNLTDVTELDSSTVEYTYDDLYRLTAETRTGTGSYTRSYGYDLAGNMTSYGGSTFASYDNTNKISSLSGGSISYDADGNMTSVSGAGIPSTTLTWTTRNRLQRQQTSTDDFTYGYDAGGKRVMKYPTGSSSTKTFYIFSGIGLIGEISSGSPTYAYSWGPGGLISYRDFGNSLSRWYHFGPQKETRQLTNGSGSVVNSYRYDGYGKSTFSSGTDFNPFKYGGGVGYYSEGAAGLMLATHRWYSPELSRWASRDPIAYDGGDNLYGYVSGNPIQYLDPRGLERSERIPHDLINLLQPYFSDLDLTKIDISRGVWNPIPGHPSGFVPGTPGDYIQLDRKIFDRIYGTPSESPGEACASPKIPRHMADIELIAHELTHVQQYHQSYWFAGRYFWRWLMAGPSYSNNSLEREARENAERIIRDLRRR